MASETACPKATIPHLHLPVTAAAADSGRALTVVALGSSSTLGAGASAPDKTYPAQLEAALRAAWPDRRVTVLNRGVGGQEADAMAARLDRDVLAAHPVLVIWQAGANAALSQMDVDLFRTALREGLSKLSASDVDVVLMDNQVAPIFEAVPNNAAYGAVLAREAALHRASVFSRTALMRQWREAGADGMIGPDGLHQSDKGYACLAAALGRAIVDAVAPAATTVGLRTR
jgi:lysophospholipase L1-like esterase